MQDKLELHEASFATFMFLLDVIDKNEGLSIENMPPQVFHFAHNEDDFMLKPVVECGIILREAEPYEWANIVRASVNADDTAEGYLVAVPVSNSETKEPGVLFLVYSNTTHEGAAFISSAHMPIPQSVNLSNIGAEELESLICTAH